MAAAATNEDKTSLKVIVHKEKNKVIFAEADGKFVNTLFSIMALPIGTIVRILEKCSDQRLDPLESLQNLYRSLAELPVGYFSTEESKFMMLNPRTSLYDRCRMLKLNIDDTEPTKYFMCENEGCNEASDSYFSTCSFARCFFCRKVMTREIKCGEIDGPINEFCRDGNVFVSNLKTFIITDDLCVKPSTLDLSLGLLCDLGFSDASQVEERTIDIGCEQMLILVKAALLLKYPLTYLVFHSIHPLTNGGLVNPKLGTWIQHLTCNEKGTNLKTMTLRVTLQKSTSKFLFAEAEEDFVEFLFGFLEIPLGTLIRKLMDGNSSLGCLENVYASICNMNLGVNYLWNLLMEPKLAWKYVSDNQIFPLDVSSDFHSIYQCSFLDDTLKRYAHGVGNPKYIMRFKDPRVQGRFLKGHMKFMLTEDLIVTPFSSVSAIAIMNELKVPLMDVEHHEVSIGIEKGLQLLNASLKSNSTWADVILKIIEKKKSVKKAAPTGKAAKDLNKPKSPASAFFVFMEDFRKQFKEDNPDNKSIAAVGSAGGAKWKTMSDAEKAPFLAHSEKRKKEYEKALASYNEKLAASGYDDDDDDYDLTNLSEGNDEDEDDY